MARSFFKVVGKQCCHSACYSEQLAQGDGDLQLLGPRIENLDAERRKIGRVVTEHVGVEQKDHKQIFLAFPSTGAISKLSLRPEAKASHAESRFGRGVRADSRKTGLAILTDCRKTF